jgi:hypothetical protein
MVVEAAMASAFAEKLRERMEETGLTVTDYAWLFKIGTGAVRGWLSGNHIPHPDIQKIALTRNAADRRDAIGGPASRRRVRE